MPEDRMTDYLDTIDAAGDFWTVTTDDQHAPGFDEWNALRLSQGQRPATFTQAITPLSGGDNNSQEN